MKIVNISNFFFFNSSYEAFSRLEIFANLYVSNLPARRRADSRHDLLINLLGRRH